MPWRGCWRAWLATGEPRDADCKLPEGGPPTHRWPPLLASWLGSFSFIVYPPLSRSTAHEYRSLMCLLCTVNVSVGRLNIDNIDSRGLSAAAGADTRRTAGCPDARSHRASTTTTLTVHRWREGTRPNSKNLFALLAVAKEAGLDDLVLCVEREPRTARQRPVGYGRCLALYLLYEG